jgi:hypothetical protein
MITGIHQKLQNNAETSDRTHMQIEMYLFHGSVKTYSQINPQTYIEHSSKHSTIEI